MVRKRSCPAVSHWQNKMSSGTNDAQKTAAHNLELDRLVFEASGADLEVHANRGDVTLGVRVIGEAEQQTALPDTRVTDEQQLEQVVVLRCGRLHSSSLWLVVALL